MNTTRIALTPGYLLHRREYRDTSFILELFSREHGRLAAFARGARGPKGRFGTLQAFQPLLLSWQGRGDAAQLTGAESAARPGTVPAPALMSAFYLNELLLKLTHQHDPHPEIYDGYEQALQQLRDGVEVETALRRFELRLLGWLGYGLDLAQEADSGKPVEQGRWYQVRLAAGVEPCDADALGAMPGRVLLDLAHERPLLDAGDQKLARLLTRRVLDQCLEGRELRTRAVARQVARREWAR
jgi:DNA repair protein RecO (recombination protein O)